MSDYPVHRCQLFDFMPRAIQCMASYSPPGGTPQILAVGRENGAIELIKCLESGFYTFLTIPGSSERNLEGLMFYEGRLFSAELQGVITEYDITKGIVKYSEDCYGGAVWCLASGNGNKKFAAGCEDGSLKIFSIEGERITFEKSFDKQQGRILSCAFHPDNEILVSGSVNIVRVWSYQSGHAIRRIQVNVSKRLDNIIWAVKILADHTIISGDTTGRVNFWNGRNATLLQSFQNHQSSVLTLCASDDESTIYTAGVDGKIIAIHRNEVDEEPSAGMDVVGMEAPPEKILTWIKGAVLQKHSHDVRSMAIVGDYLATGGVDTNILLYNIKTPNSKILKKIAPFPHHSLVHVSSISRTFLLQYPRHLDVWMFASPASLSGSVGETIELLEEPLKLFQINLPGSELDEIMCSCISQCGSWVAYATSKIFKLFWLTIGDTSTGDVSLTKVPTRWVKSPSAMQFSADSKFLIVASNSGKYYITKLDGKGHAHLEHIIENDQENAMAVSLAANETFFAAADIENNIKIYHLEKAELKCTLPRHDSIPTALAFKPATNNLMVAYQNHSLVEYDADAETYTDWCKIALNCKINLLQFSLKYRSHSKLVKNWNTSPITNISFASETKVVFSSHNKVYVLDLSEDPLKAIVAAEEKHLEDVRNGTEADLNFREKLISPVRRIKDFTRHMLYFGFIDSDTSVFAVEKDWKDIFYALPESLYQKKFGT